MLCLSSHSGTTKSSSSSPSALAPEGEMGEVAAAVPLIRPPACKTQSLYMRLDLRSRYGPDSCSKFERSSAIRSCSKSVRRSPS